ncbi:restriction endonuclease subunit S, partial [Anaerovibrio slackiae]|uniref:restriction endonuclease subunit S n=1 Tax=Anaerovibrio slackiae TaxID=2652309 RepID=UPI00386B96DB
MKVILQDVCSPKTSNLAQKDLIGRDGDYPVYGASGYIGNINFYHQANKCVAVVKDGAGIGRTMLLPEKSTAIGTMQYLIPKENILPEYLFYAVKNMHLEKYYTGATIPHIYFKDYKNEKFNYIDLEQQLCIVNTLKLVECIISKKTKQLEQLDNLVKSLFVEMFINENYTKKKLGECAIINPKKSS